ncbi:MAG TPA: ABC-2 family transporter protein [Candidatus Dependentiae bacterium]|nr:ABC-2 family transporter protein [Candidatus Dependentiae bacterium]
MKRLIHNKYWKIFVCSAMQQWHNRLRLLAKIVLYLFVVYLYYQIVTSTGAGPERVIYIAMTELMILSFAPVTFQIARDIESGCIDYFLVRPVNYIGYTLIGALGESLVKYIVLGSCCFVWVGFLTNTVPRIPEFLFGLLLGLVSLLLYLLITIFIGISSFWFNDVKDLFYLNLTACFCFGGLIVPLEFYSGIIQKISLYTPYPLILWVPAHLVASGSAHIPFIFVSTMLWLTVLVFLIRMIYRTFLSVYLRKGGR